MNTLPLLPYKFRYVGIFSLFIAITGAYLYFFGGKPAFFTIPVFAAVTSYLETRTMVIAQTNVLDETALIFFIISLIFLGFSKEKNETARLQFLRFKSIILSVYITSGIWILLAILIYGWAIFIVSSGVFILFLLLNLIY